MSSYRPRIIDERLTRLLDGVGAVSIEGARAVGKTRMAMERGETFLPVDDPDMRDQLLALGARFAEAPGPIVIDEWQRLPELWDRVRRAVDLDMVPGHFILTGSSPPLTAPAHTGAGRIVNLRLRPFSLVERDLAEPTVSLRALATSEPGRPALVEGLTDIRIDRYVDEICRSGFPGIRHEPLDLRESHLDSYLEQTVRHELAQNPGRTRATRSMEDWLRAYASAEATTASMEKIGEVAERSFGTPVSMSTARRYRDHLASLWILDPLRGWSASANEFSRANLGDKHFLCDPALTARMLGYGPAEILGLGSPPMPRPRGAARRPRALGPLLEALVVQSLRVYADALRARTYHLRTRGGEHEVDVIIETTDRRVLAFEVKASPTPRPGDTRHLLWLRRHLGDRLADAVVVTTGAVAYRDEDGIAVVPAALLGP